MENLRSLPRSTINPSIRHELVAIYEHSGPSAGSRTGADSLEPVVRSDPVGLSSQAIAHTHSRRSKRGAKRAASALAPTAAAPTVPASVVNRAFGDSMIDAGFDFPDNELMTPATLEPSQAVPVPAGAVLRPNASPPLLEPPTAAVAPHKKQRTGSAAAAAAAAGGSGGGGSAAGAVGGLQRTGSVVTASPVSAGAPAPIRTGGGSAVPVLVLEQLFLPDRVVTEQMIGLHTAARNGRVSDWLVAAELPLKWVDAFRDQGFTVMWDVIDLPEKHPDALRSMGCTEIGNLVKFERAILTTKQMMQPQRPS